METEISKDEKEDANIKEALELAKNIHKIVLDPRFNQAYDEETRHKVVMKKYPNFANAYPIILRFIARDLKYNENAFKKFLNKLKVDPGKGMEGFIERQSDYAKFLYIEDSKKNGRHWSIKKANQIWNIEYNNMNSWMKKIKKEEESAKNEFEEEKKKNLEIKRKELLEFIRSETFNQSSESESEDIDNYERIALGLHPKSLGDIEFEKLNKSDLLQFIRQLNDYKLSLKEDIDEKILEFNSLKDELNSNVTIEEYNYNNETISPELELEVLVNYTGKIKINIIHLETVKYNLIKKIEILKMEHKILQEKQIKDKIMEENKSEWLEGVVKPNLKPKSRFISNKNNSSKSSKSNKNKKKR